MKCNLIILAFFVAFASVGGWYLFTDHKKIEKKPHVSTSIEPLPGHSRQVASSKVYTFPDSEKLK